MKNRFFSFLCFFVFFTNALNAQIITSDSFNNNGLFQQDSTFIDKKTTVVTLNGKTTYTDYKIISFKKDTTYIDTTLSILKEYKYNFLRKDNFELLAFHNQGQTFNRLGYDFEYQPILPAIGMQAKHYNYQDAEDVNYFEVPTPTTEILYRTGLQQGQVLETLFTLNFSRRFNVAIDYKGLRSLGNYRNSLSSQGNFTSLFSYHTENKRYFIRGHISKQDLLNEENGGLKDSELIKFTTNNPNFKDRGRLDVHLEGTETNLEGNRIYFEHDYKLFSSKDSIQSNFTNLKIGHSFLQENKIYSFSETLFSETSLNTDFFGDADATDPFEDSVEHTHNTNQLFLEFNSKYILGTFKIKTNYTKYTYGYDSIVNTTITKITTPKIKGNLIHFGAEWKAVIQNFELNSIAEISPGSGRLSGNNFYSEARFTKDSLYTLKASISINSKMPNFNTVLFQSRYDDYNWENNAFKKINTRNVHFGIRSDWINATASFTTIENYTYFNEVSQPQQSDEHITYLKLKVNNEFKLGKFGLHNTVLFQQVSKGAAVFRVPNFVTRNTLYYTDFLFEGKPLFLQTGITFNYFSTYNANAFDPLLNEFTIQNTTEIGYPTFDVFINAQVKRTRIYLKADNVSSPFLKKNYFSAPNHPYRDFVIRFGLVWNWFI